MSNMGAHDADWLNVYATQAALTDQFKGGGANVELLCLGLLGEAGGLVSEFKKEVRDGRAYVAHLARQQEELGDFLWYFSRLVGELDPTFWATTPSIQINKPQNRSLSGIKFMAVATELARVATQASPDSKKIRAALAETWTCFEAMTAMAQTTVQAAAEGNRTKVQEIWPTQRRYHALFDDEFPDVEQLPRSLEVEFRKMNLDVGYEILIRCNGINIGDRISDNISSPDGYRFHDVFHLAHATHLGWSPVLRALLRCKRKSAPTTDRNEDGARAAIMEEAVAAAVFSHAKKLNFLEGIDRIDLDLLKLIKRLVEGYEVADVGLWQWQEAILDGYRMFRLLRQHEGGHIHIDLPQHTMTFSPPRTEIPR